MDITKSPISVALGQSINSTSYKPPTQVHYGWTYRVEIVCVCVFSSIAAFPTGRDSNLESSITVTHGLLLQPPPTPLTVNLIICLLGILGPGQNDRPSINPYLC